ncbi:MAG: amidohydrolase [Pseudomonadota bacterium]|nr:amidohydrolase [Pseudomonadota bacterium]
MQRRLSSLTTIFAALISNAALAAPDLIVVNGDVYTVDFDAPRVEAIAVEDGRFTAVGRNADIRSMAGASTHIIDAGGNTVLPGLIDGHAHVSGNAPAVAGVDLSYVVEKDDWLQLIEEADARMPEGEWMTGGYWDHTLSDAEFPTKELLDEVVPDRPIFLNHIDGHYAWVNSLALDLAEVTADTRVPPGGEIVVDKDTGEPTGILLETAMGVVRGIIPERSEVQRRQGLAEMYQIANSFGITGLHQMGGLEDYLYIVEQGDPTMRVWYGQRGPTGAVAAYDEHVQQILDLQAKTKQRVSDTGKQETSGPLLHVGYVKLMNDGVLSAHTAVLLESYRDREGWMGEYITEPIDLATQVDEVTRAGLPVAIHSIGDAAVRASLDAFETAKGNPVPHPNRIEHIELAHEDDVLRFAELNIVASMQPNHATNAIGYVPLRVGTHREDRAYVWRSMLDADVTLVFAADYPTSPLNPLVQMADAMFRVSPFGFHNNEPWHPEQALTFEEALHAYTMAGASVSAWGDEIGSITEGKWADFVVLDGTVPAPMGISFRNLVVERTYFAGREVYANP